MLLELFHGVALPFWGTALGAACVFALRAEPGAGLRRALSGFAGGIMAAASVWSLLIPAMERSGRLGRFAFLPGAAGLWMGALFLVASERLWSRLRPASGGSFPRRPGSTALLVLAVTLHNLPEGMAVGAAYAELLRPGSAGTVAGAFALALGIAIQNFPEGAIISMPLHAQGVGRGKAFLFGALSGAVEPLGALLTLALSRLALPLMPLLLGFAAGAMLFVTAAELLPECVGPRGSRLGPTLFLAGFTLMMSLDASLS